MRIKADLSKNPNFCCCRYILSSLRIVAPLESILKRGKSHSPCSPSVDPQAHEDRHAELEEEDEEEHEEVE